MSRQNILFFRLKLRQSCDFSNKILLQIHDLWTNFHSKTAKIILIRANLSLLQSCLFYHLDTVAAD